MYFRFRCRATSRGERVQAEASQFGRGHVVADGSGGDTVADQAGEHAVQVVFGGGDLVAPVQECGQFGVAVPLRLMSDVGVRPQDGFQAEIGVGMPLGDCSELTEVGVNLPLVPRVQDGFDVWEVLVQGGSSDAGLFGDLRHRHPEQPVLVHEDGGGGHDRLANLLAVRVDRVVPQLWHMPRWVKVGVAVTVIIVALFVVLLLVGNGHGPGRHMTWG